MRRRAPDQEETTSEKLGECDLAIVSHEDEGLPTDELESKKSELEKPSPRSTRN